MMRAMPALALIAAATLLGGAVAPGEPAPRVSARTVQDLRIPLPAPYDAKADANADVQAAMARAKVSGKQLLIDFGANWCLDCRVLAGILALPEVEAYVARHYELVSVDVGRFDRNLDLATRFSKQRLGAVPAVFVIDARTGKLRNAKETLGLGDARIMKPQAVADWLAKWAR